MNEIDILKEINKSSKTGIDGINYTFSKVKDSQLKDLLYKEKDEYQNIYDRSKEILIQKNEDTDDTKTMQKIMSWMGIELNTLTDKSSSQIAEMLIQGNNMGVIKGTKLLNNMQFEDTQIQNLLEDFIRLQQKNIEDLKKYL
ncbi:MAG: hypothetical protein Q4D02_01570 [Clostridia bacterium]|nr:hypothetical protein [Clostridia bacterium]